MKKEKLVMNINHIIANELSVKLWQVDAAIKLIDEGNTIPFIARQMCIRDRFYDFIRPERTFDSLEKLKQQIEADIETCRRIVGNK